jgi:hypothetical protein
MANSRMWKYLWISPALLTVATACAWGGCVAAGAAGQVKWVLLAAGGCLVAGVAGGLPLALVKSRAAATVMLAAFAGTVVHLLAAAVTAGAIILACKPGWPFGLWMCGFFWLTLGVLAVVSTRAIKAAAGGK